MWGRRTAAAAWELQMGGEESMGRKKREENICQRKSKTVKRKRERYGFISV